MQLRATKGEAERQRALAAAAAERAAALQVHVQQLQCRVLSGEPGPTNSGLSGEPSTESPQHTSPLKAAAESLGRASARVAARRPLQSGLLQQLSPDTAPRSCSGACAPVEHAAVRGVAGPATAAPAAVALRDSRVASWEERLHTREGRRSAAFEEVLRPQTGASPVAEPAPCPARQPGSPKRPARELLGIKSPGADHSCGRRALFDVCVCACEWACACRGPQAGHNERAAPRLGRHSTAGAVSRARSKRCCVRGLRTGSDEAQWPMFVYRNGIWPLGAAHRRFT